MEKTIEELQAELTAAVEKISSLTASVSSLETTNAALKSEKVDAKTKADQAARDAAEKAGNVEALKASHQAELDRYRAELDTERAAHHARLKSHELTAAFAAAKVDPAHLDLLTAANIGRIEVRDGGAMIGDKTVGAHFAEYFAGTGAAYIEKPANSDVGMGLRNAAKATPDAWSLDAYNRLKKENGETAKAYAAKHGHDYLS
jgi:multidrug efflux pump subunit AcrA (membrane-fusion protein)